MNSIGKEEQKPKAFPILKSAVYVGSALPQLETVWERLEKTGIRVEKYERDAFSGKEQGVDQCLQLWMLRALADADCPSVAVYKKGWGNRACHMGGDLCPKAQGMGKPGRGV